MQLFYSKEITETGYATLDTEESRHAVRVLRMREGDELHVTDGCGHLYRCAIVAADASACVVETLLEVTPPADTPRCRLHLAVAPTKNPSRMEWLVEKAVEVGIDELTLLDCDHSERSFLKTDRLERIALSAMKQSLHLSLPRINPAIALQEWMESGEGRAEKAGAVTQKFIAHCEAGQPRTPLAEALLPGHDAVVLIGPEGDFSEEEIQLALRQGFQPVSLGPSRLRTETAALYAAVAFSVKNEE